MNGFGGTEGFYWGDNNAKDLNVRLEYKPDPHGAPEYLPYVPMARDLAWQQMYQKYRGAIDEQFGFLAFRTAPLVTSSTMDAKVATADMASRMMVWGAIGKPNQTPWVAGEKGYSKNDGLFPSGYRLFNAQPPAGQVASTAPLTSKPATSKPDATARTPKGDLWTGWLLPASSADDWFVAGSTAYYRDLRSEDLEEAMKAHWAAYRRLQMEEPNDRTRYDQEMHKGAIFLDSLREQMGDDKFVKLMRGYFEANTTKRVTAQSFLDAAGAKFTMPADKGGSVYVADDIYERASSALIVYGTGADAGSNRYAAEQFQKRLYNNYESAVPIRKDFEVTDEELRTHDVIFVGRPESNAALAVLAQRIGLDYSEALFRINGTAHAYERSALLFAAANPFDRRRMVLVMAGNDALDTVKLASSNLPEAQYAIYEDGMQSATGFVQ